MLQSYISVFNKMVYKNLLSLQNWFCVAHLNRRKQPFILWFYSCNREINLPKQELRKRSRDFSYLRRPTFLGCLCKLSPPLVWTIGWFHPWQFRDHHFHGWYSYKSQTNESYAKCLKKIRCSYTEWLFRISCANVYNIPTMAN